MLGISTTNARVGGFRGGISAEAKTIYNRIIADGGVSNLTRLNFFVKGLKAIYGDLANVPVCYDAHWIGYKLGSGTGATAGQAAAKLYSIKNTENLLTFSEEFDNAAWTKNSSTITPNATIAPNGTLTADKLIDTASSAQHWAFQSTTNTLTSATISCYMKKGERNWGVIRTRTTINDYFAWFNLDNGTLGTVESGITASITDAGNGWYRCIVVNPNPTTSANPSIIGLSNANNVTTYTGDGTSGIFVWGAQFNTGSVALPYTQTTTTAQTLADAVQSTAASQPLLLSHNGDNYWWGSGVSGNYCSTPNAAANQITGDIEIIAKIQGTFSTGQRIVRKRSTIVNYDFYISDVTNTQLSIFFGATIGIAVSNVGFTMISTGLFVKVTRLASNGDVKFFTSSDGVTYTQLGATQSTISGNLTSSTDIVEIGSAASGASANFQGKIYRATISNSIGGAPVVDFNPAQYNASTSQTAWTSATGEVWTINTGTATTGYKGTIVDRVIVMSDGVDDNMISTVNRANLLTQYLAVKPYINDNTVDRTVIDANGTSFQNSISLTSSLFYYVLNGFGGSKAISNTINTLQILAAISNAGVKNSLSKNNSGEVSDTYTPTPSSNGIFVFGKGNGAANGKSNVILNTYIYINLADNLTIQTSTYNLLKTLNNL